jgi:hypothetical protein
LLLLSLIGGRSLPAQVSHSSFRHDDRGEKSSDGGCPPSLLESAEFPSRLERDASVELDLPAADCGARDIRGFPISDCIVARLTEAGAIDHVARIGTDFELNPAIGPKIERLAK